MSKFSYHQFIQIFSPSIPFSVFRFVDCPVTSLSVVIIFDILSTFTIAVCHNPFLFCDFVLLAQTSQNVTFTVSKSSHPEFLFFSLVLLPFTVTTFLTSLPISTLFLCLCQESFSEFFLSYRLP